MTHPARLGRYDVHSIIGKGAMGTVFKGYDPSIDRVVALKTINTTGLDEGDLKVMLARFKQEARLAGKLNHPHIVTIFDVGDEFIAMEYLEGFSLKETVARDGPLPVGESIRIVTEIAAGLDHAHAHGIIHRDIKPANIHLVGAERQVKITDFGIAKAGSGGITATGLVVGSPSYMSPEQVTGTPLDHRSDLFSLAVVAYELLCGMPPFTGDHITTIAYKIVHEDPRPAKELKGALPDEVDQVLARALAKDPTRRFSSAGAFAAALGAAIYCLDGQETVLSKTVPDVAPPVPPPVTPPSVSPSMEIPPPPRGPVPSRSTSTSFLPWALLGSGLLIVAAAVAYFLWPGKENSGEPTRSPRTAAADSEIDSRSPSPEMASAGDIDEIPSPGDEATSATPGELAILPAEPSPMGIGEESLTETPELEAHSELQVTSGTSQLLTTSEPSKPSDQTTSEARHAPGSSTGSSRTGRTSPTPEPKVTSETSGQTRVETPTKSTSRANASPPPVTPPTPQRPPTQYLSTLEVKIPHVQAMFHHKDELYVADSGKECILVLNPRNGQIRQTIELPDEPGGVYVDSQKRIWVANEGDSAVERFLQDGTRDLSFGKKGEVDLDFDACRSIVGLNNRIWVADTGNSRLVQLDDQGRLLSTVKDIRRPRALTLDGRGHLLVCSQHQVLCLDESGGMRWALGKKGTEDGAFSEPQGLAVHGQFLAVADTGNHRVQIFDIQSRHHLGSFGSKGKEPGQFREPRGIAFVGDRILVACENETIQVFGAPH